MAKSIKQIVTFSATAEVVYALLMNSKKHSAFSEAPAKISTKIGGKVSCYSGYIDAINIELNPNKKIIQAWRGSDWKAGDWSLVIYSLKNKGKKTELTFEQHGIPDEHVTHIKQGWKDHYWNKMKEYISNNN
jgi:activator of HSP90 ATPase